MEGPVVRMGGGNNVSTTAQDRATGMTAAERRKARQKEYAQTVAKERRQKAKAERKANVDAFMANPTFGIHGNETKHTAWLPNGGRIELHDSGESGSAGIEGNPRYIIEVYDNKGNYGTYTGEWYTARTPEQAAAAQKTLWERYSKKKK